MGEQVTGLRRVGWVRVLLGAEGPRAEVVGVGHRFPGTSPISLSSAARLAAGGVPLVVRDLRTEA